MKVWNRLVIIGRAIQGWIKVKTLTITSALLFFVPYGNEHGWWDLDLSAVMKGFGFFLAFVIGGTVTANARLNGGKMWGGLNGKDLPAVPGPAADPPPPADPS